MGNSKKATGKVIVISTPEQNPEPQVVAKTVDPNQQKLALRTKPASPTKLRINTVQGKALAEETVQLVRQEIERRKDSLRYEPEYLAAQQTYMATDPLAVALSEMLAVVPKMGEINRLIEQYNDTCHREQHPQHSYVQTPNKIDELKEPYIRNKLDSIRNEFFYRHYRKELSELENLNLSKEVIYNRIMISTIKFQEAVSLQQFQRQTIADLYPAVVRVVPALDPEKFVEPTSATNGN